MTVAQLHELFQNRHVVVIGDVMLDRYISGTVDRISPEAPVPVLHVTHYDERPGGAANVALNLQALGARVTLCGQVGKDDAGKRLKKLVQRPRLCAHFITMGPGCKTTVKTRILARNQQMLRLDEETPLVLPVAFSRKVIKSFVHYIRSDPPQAVVLQDYNKGTLFPELIEALITFCKENNIFIAVDPKRDHFFSYRHVDLFKPNLREVHEALRWQTNSCSLQELKNMDRALRRRLKHRITLLTLADKGIFASDGRATWLLPAHKRNVADVSGAGDTVVAVATLALISGMNLRQTAELANLSGGLVCEFPGVVPITYDLLAQCLTSHR